MEKLSFPDFRIRLKNKENKHFIFDIIRKKWFLLTQEEWVRQHCIHFLIFFKKYPKSLINVEKKLLVNGLPKRYDIIVYSKKGNVILLVECKAPNIKISQDVFDQIAKYNLSIKSKYLMVSNGLSHYFCEVNYESNDYYFLADIPDFKTFN
ncbi:MAG: type I restriction enzyme HsdR N-terminal domain-containing protein [Flavobacteriaceae bacterium]|nr:type I restriction enzyme HsdR N-terminal domain-containing protein [Flavobacteriaceae bacterium]